MNRKTEAVAEPPFEDDALAVALKEIARLFEQAFAPVVRGIEATAVQIAPIKETVRRFEQALAPIMREIALMRRELENGGWQRNMVLNAADRALSENVADSERCKGIREDREKFLASFAVITDDAKTKEEIREASFEAFIRGLYIGSELKSPEFVKEIRQAHAATMRRERASKSAPKQEAIEAAVRAAMSATKVKPTRGEGYSNRILPDVISRLGWEVSASTVRNYVRKILDGRAILKELP